MGTPTNPTISTLLNRRSIRKFSGEPLDADTIDTLERVAQQAPTCAFLNDFSAIRVTDQSIKDELARIGNQPYIATAPLLYVFIADEHRNTLIAQHKGIDPNSDDFALNTLQRFVQAHNDAVLALHAMETGANALGLGCLVFGSLLNNIEALIDLLRLPKYTYPVLGLAIGKPDQEPELKPRMPRAIQFFENTYHYDTQKLLSEIAAFDEVVHTYYDLRDTRRPVDAFSEQIAEIAKKPNMAGFTMAASMQQQGFSAK